MNKDQFIQSAISTVRWGLKHLTDDKLAEVWNNSVQHPAFDLTDRTDLDLFAEWLYMNDRVILVAEVKTGDPKEETWDVEVREVGLTFEQVAAAVRSELNHEITSGYVSNYPEDWDISVYIVEIL